MTRPKPSTATPTRDQLLNLANRAENKGGLNAAEADRLRRGLEALLDSLELAQERVDHYKTVSEHRRRRIERLKQLRPDQRVAVQVEPVGDSRLARLSEMAHRWLSIPRRQEAGQAVLAIVNDRPARRKAS